MEHADNAGADRRTSDNGKVRLPWWSQSLSLLPRNVHPQLVKHAGGMQATEAGSLQDRKLNPRVAAASRTPSPDYGYRRDYSDGLPPPKLLLAPAAGEAHSSTGSRSIGRAASNDATGPTTDVCLAPGGCLCAEKGKPVEERECGRVTISVPADSVKVVPTPPDIIERAPRSKWLLARLEQQSQSLSATGDISQQHMDPVEARPPMMEQVTQDVCLAPGGDCACARSGQVIGNCGSRVKVLVSAIAADALLAPGASAATPSVSSTHKLHSITGRNPNRTPSPELSRSNHPRDGLIPKPRLLLAPVVSQTSAVEASDHTTATEERDDEVHERESTCGTQGSAESTKSDKRRPRRGRHSALRVATQLKKLDEIETQRVVAVRKIACLGLQANTLLSTYFEAFGTVEDVLLSGAHDKEDVVKHERLRPSGFGFIVMAEAAGARAAIDAGELHFIGENQFHVQEFRRKINQGGDFDTIEEHC